MGWRSVGVGCARCMTTILLVGSSSLAATLHVPADYPTIQAGLDAANFGDTVLLAPGVYTEYVTRSSVTTMAVLKDGVVVAGDGGAESVILLHGLTPNGSFATTFYGSDFTSDLTTVRNLTIESSLPNRWGIELRACAGIRVENCSFRGLAAGVRDDSLYPTGEFLISESHFEDILMGGSVRRANGTSVVTRCTFERCPGPALWVSSPGSPFHRGEIRECTFEDCGSVDGSGGGALVMGRFIGGSLVDRCVFIRCQATSGGALYVGGGSPIVSNCVFVGCRAVSGAAGVTLNGVGQARVIGNTFFDSELLELLPPRGAAAHFIIGLVVDFSNNIVSSTCGGPAIGQGAIDIESGCNVFWDNIDGIGYQPGPTDRVVDPGFCDAASGDVTVSRQSPCTPANSLGCGRIGALDTGCGTVSVRQASWGSVKAGYRDRGSPEK